MSFPAISRHPMVAWSMRGLALAGFVAFHVSTASPAFAQPAPDEKPPADVAQPPKDAHRSRSGLSWKILRPGRGPERAERNDCVSALYTIWKRDGSVLGSSRTWSQSGKTCLRAMIPGMAEAVKGMAPGEQRRIWIPARLGYDDDDDKARATDLTVDFELIEIQKAPPVPVDLKSPPASATKLPSGVSYRRIKKGSGTEHPSSKTQMLLDFSGWTLNGDLIESTVMAGHPASYELISAMRGWRDVLQLMVVGDKVRIWIPAALAFGDKPRRGQPKGDLVYDLELLALK